MLFRSDFNEELISDTNSEFLLSDGVGSTVTKLNPMSESVQCWTCGSQVDRNRVSNQLDELRNVIEEKRAERTGVQSQVEDLRGKQEELQDEIERRDELSRRLNARFRFVVLLSSHGRLRFVIVHQHVPFSFLRLRLEARPVDTKPGLG